jgi:hypothetical protein
MATPIVIVDSHVHIHPGADVAAMLSAAASHFARVARRAAATRWQGVLMLAEMQGVDWFGAASSRHEASAFGSWRVQRSESENLSLRAEAGDAVITLVAGRQIATQERLEVLALATRSVFADGGDLQATIAAALEARAIVVLPWAVGKWLGPRGRLIEDAFAADRETKLLAGDNSGRPIFWREPRAFATVRARGRPVLPGTDPLPLRNAESRVGSFGFWMEGELPQSAPAGALRDLLGRAHAAQVHAFGRRETPWGFVRDQIGLRLQKHR